VDTLKIHGPDCGADDRAEHIRHRIYEARNHAEVIEKKLSPDDDDFLFDLTNRKIDENNDQ